MAEPHVVTALVAKRAELAGQIQALEKQVAQLRADLVHVDAVWRMFNPAADPAAIPAKRPYRRRRWFKEGWRVAPAHPRNPAGAPRRP
jgi:hypothetical protein